MAATDSGAAADAAQPAPGQPGVIAPDNATGEVEVVDIDESGAAQKEKVKYGSMRYVLVLYRNAKRVETHPLPSIPSAKSIRCLVASEVRYTMEDNPIREHTSTRSWALAFRGMTGVKIYGMSSLLAFDRFLHLYQTEAFNEGSLYLNNNKQRDVRDRTWLELHDTEDGVGWKVEVRGWDWDRSAQTRVKNAEWVLNLQGYAFVEGIPRRGGIDFRSRPKIDKEKLAAQATQLATAEQAVSAQSAVNARAIRAGANVYALNPVKALPKPWILIELEKVSTWIKESFGPIVANVGASVAWVKKAMAIAAETVKNIEAFANTVTTYANNVTISIQSLLALPRRVLNTILNSIRAVRRSIQKVIELVGAIVSLFSTKPWVDLWNSFAAAFDMESLFTEALGLAGGKVDYKGGAVTDPIAKNTATYAAEVDDPFSGSFVPYKMNPGDTLESIAYGLYGDASLWRKIAEANGMQRSDAAADGTPVGAGTILLLPYSAVAGISVPQAQKAKDLYGTDWAIDPETGDRVLDTKTYTYFNGTSYVTDKPQGGDYKKVYGATNLIQAVSNRARTVQGSVPSAPEYGVLPAAPGTVLTKPELADLLIGVKTQMLRDGRVLQVKKIQPIKKADKLTLSFQIVPINGGSLGVVAPLGN